MPALEVALAVVVVLMAGWLVTTFNQLVRHTNLTREAWSGVDVQLKRRSELVPNLVAAVRGYMQHERQLLEEVTSLRSRGLEAGSIQEKGAAESALSQALGRLFAVAGAYPDLKANQSFLDLQHALTEIEDQLQLARRYYNGSVRDYDILVESFPSNLVAKLGRFRPADYFALESPAEGAVPAVTF